MSAGIWDSGESEAALWFAFIFLFILGASICLYPFLSTSASSMSAEDRHCLFCLNNPLLGCKPPPREVCVLWARHEFRPQNHRQQGEQFGWQQPHADGSTAAAFSCVLSSVNTRAPCLSLISEGEPEIEICRAVGRRFVAATSRIAIV